MTYPIVTAVSQDFQSILGKGFNMDMTIGDHPKLTTSKDTNGKLEHIPSILDNELVVQYKTEPTSDYDVCGKYTAGVTQPIYIDRDVRAMATPKLARTTLTLSYGFYSTSKSEVARVGNRLRMLAASEARQRLHTLEYFYYAPKELTYMASVINDLKNTYVTPPLDFDRYVANTFDDRADLLNSHSGDSFKTDLVIRERQLEVLGSISTDVYNIAPAYDDTTNRWYLEIEYVLDYEYPVQLYISYPMTVYNQLMPKEYIPLPASPVVTGVNTRGEQLLHEMGHRTDTMIPVPTNSYYLRIPAEDNLLLREPESGYVRIMSVVSIVDPALPNDLFYLDEIPYVTFKPEIISLMVLEALRIGDQNYSIFYFELFHHTDKQYNYRVKATPVVETVNGVLTERIKFTTDKPLLITGSYRVSISILTDLTIMPTIYLDALKANIATVDAASAINFSVIDSVMGVLALDQSKLNPYFEVTPNATSMDIALNINGSLWHRVFTKQVSLVLTSALTPK